MSKRANIIACECGKVWRDALHAALADGWVVGRGFECGDCASGRFKFDATLNCRPAKGLWVVHRGRGRTYGRIIEVRRDGTVVWEGTFGAKVPTRPKQLIDGGYEYSETPLEEQCSQ
jgi:hypothetical protein